MVTLASVNKARQASGQKTVAAPLSTRAVQQQAQYQDTVRANNILSKATAQSYIDPTTGMDSRSFNDDGSVVEGTGKMSTLRGGAAIGDTNGTIRDVAMQGGQSQYKEAPAATIGSGQIAQNRFQRLVDSGLTPEAAAKRTNDTSGIKSASTQVGTGLGMSAPGKMDPSARKAAREAEISGLQGKKLVQRTNEDGSTYYEEVVDPELTAKLQNDAKNRYMEEDRLEFDQAKNTKDTKEALDPDVLASVEAAKKGNTGRIQAETGMSAVDAAPDDIKAIFEEHPEMADIYEPLVEALIRDDKNQASMLMATLSRLDKQGERAAKVASDAIAASKDYHKQLAGQLEDSYDLQLDLAEEQKRQAEFDQAQYEHKQSFVISQRIEQAAEDEMVRRRSAAGQGFTSDTSGLSWMQKEARKAQDSISFLQSETNMVSAEMARRASTEYSLSIRDLGQQYDANILKLDNSLNGAIAEIQSTLNMGDEQRATAYEGAYQSYLKKVGDNDIKMAEIYGGIVGKLNDQAFEIKKINLQEEKADKRMMWQEEQADKRMKFQESQLDKRLMYSEGQANRRYEMELMKTQTAEQKAQMKEEKGESEKIRSEFRDLMKSSTVQNFKQIRDYSKQATAYLDSALESGDSLELGAAKEAIGYMRAKGLDPITGVRDGDYARLGKDQGWIDKFTTALEAIEGGDLTGLSTDLVKVFTEGLELSAQTYLESSAADLGGALNRLIEFNNSSEFLRLDPKTIPGLQDFPIDDALESFYSNKLNTDYNYDYGKYSNGMSSSEPTDNKVANPVMQSLPATGMSMDEIMYDYSQLQSMESPQARRVIESDGTESVGDILASFAPVTQNFNTPISEKNYSAATVKAWGGTHQGLDVALPWGSFVPSLTDGVLKSVEYSKSGWGLSAIVQAPDGAEVRYAHLLSLDPRLKIGQEIPRGMEFAQVGNTGNVFSANGGDGTHLDFRVRKGGKYIDPYSYFG